ncbi:hypothetical protein NEF87_004273 [Candidatus Lokiarchaeum ossiferum]|uniref:Glycosyl transferase CAP10 domain-containing protein n=1 Tax=Candidatus Lokiarchaeum ossiferum TaxID=2951803 RepID=A0ABY6HX91_9ARCH|nr:hypothetical protein NEF87_004273 [Candidatus Lokiarchaeum sp. B-35]
MNIDERVQYYMGKWWNTDLVIDRRQVEKFSETLPHWNDLTVLYNDHIFKKYHSIPYIKDFQRILNLLSIPNKNNKFIVQFGDISSHFPDLPVIMKYRTLSSSPDKMKDNSIVFKLNIFRHWLFFDDINQNDVSWDEKSSRIVWRGITTGYGENNPRYRLVRTYMDKYFISDKFRLLKKSFFKLNRIIACISRMIPLKLISYFSSFLKKKCDNYLVFNIGFNEICQEQQHLSKNVKGFMSIKEQLQYKYIISIEGNDVATNLKWGLYSNSLVLMPKPSVESWLMEGKLKPYVHYVPLNDKLDNLEEIYKWCVSNDKKCKKIASNATKYMEKFIDLEQENAILLKILKIYCKNIKIEL